jgi:5-methylcytosine-specific restriction endonuclease McrA
MGRPKGSKNGQYATTTKACKRCGEIKTYQKPSRAATGVYCSLKCSIEAASEVRTREAYARTAKTCRRCKAQKPREEFCPGRPGLLGSYCYDCHNLKQKERRQNLSPDQRLKYRLKARPSQTATQARRRAQKFDTQLEMIRLVDILKRDGPCCYLCGTNPATKPTMDHVHALVRGGTHTKENIKIACKRCNSRKGAKLVSDLDWALPSAKQYEVELLSRVSVHGGAESLG